MARRDLGEMRLRFDADPLKVREMSGGERVVEILGDVIRVGGDRMPAAEGRAHVGTGDEIPNPADEPRRDPAAADPLPNDRMVLRQEHVVEPAEKRAQCEPHGR